MDNTKFNIEYQYSLYLKRMKLDESEMHACQKQETKRAFMGGMGQMIALLIDHVHDLDQDDAVKMFNQVNAFFMKESHKAN